MTDPKRAKALSALMDSGTLTEAAEKAGISRKTLYTYLRNDKAFARAYEDAQNQLALEQMEAISEAREQARGVILELMNDAQREPSTRLRAAQIILGHAEEQQKRALGVIRGNADRTPLDDIL